MNVGCHAITRQSTVVHFCSSAHQYSMTSFYWQLCNGGDIPMNAVKAGRDRDDSPIVVGRAQHERDLLPAKVVPNKGGAYVTHGGKEYFKVAYEVHPSHGVCYIPHKGKAIPTRSYEVLIDASQHEM